MATMNSVIEHVDSVKPNVYSEDDKYQWINTLEGMVSREVMQEEAPACELPGDADRELLVGYPYEEIYSLYVMAMIDFHNREYANYNNVMLMFQERLDQFKAWYIRHHAAGTARNFRNVMG